MLFLITLIIILARFVGRKMEKLAVNVLDECQDANAAKTKKLLGVSRPNWGSSSCIKIAFSAANYEFTSHNSVQNIVNKMWHGENISRCLISVGK